MPPQTQREREAVKRAEKLAQVNEQVEAGSLSIRQMTDEERARYQPRPRPQSSRRPRRTAGR